MSKELNYEGKVVIVTGAGNGLGRSHALGFAARGAKVIVNDLGGSHTGEGKSAAAADQVVEEIRGAGGDAQPSYDSVTDGEKIVQAALDHYGRIDVVVNNAGILRDVSFHKMTQEDWDLIYQVHVLGSFKVTHAAWPHLRGQQYGRVVMTSSAAGIYGNFGQANYAMAKLGLAGFSNTLAVEGQKKNVFVNTIAPVAGSRMTETVLPPNVLEHLRPEYVTPLVLWLCHEECKETGGLFEVGGGYFGKLRWERADGQMYRVGREIRAEDVRASFGKVVDFGAAHHPENITASLGPVMENIQAGPSKGGNEWIDVDEALGYEFPETTTSYDERDLALYALGVGAGSNPLDSKELQLVYELSGDGFVPLPTYAVVPAINELLRLGKEGKTAPGLKYGLDRVLHGEQYTELLRPLPKKATLTHRMRIKDIFDKGKGALVVTETKSYDESGELLMINDATTFVRGAGDFGGDRGPSSNVNTPPERDPDAVVEQKTDESQALLYRLSGDWNPLHADPGFAKAFGFDKPILHGLCTFGFAGRHVLHRFAKDNDPRYFKSIKVRFADSVFPGETLVTEMWKETDQRILFRCKVKERDVVVISNAAIELYETIPVAKAAPKAADAAPPASEASVPVSADIFGGIDRYVKSSPELVQKVQTVFQFRLSDPASVWTIDVKNGSGGASPGESPKADTVLEISDADFMDMCTGKADPQKLYFGGKLKISGDVMASQKLTFLKKVDPKLVEAAMAERVGGVSSAPEDAGGSLPDSVPIFLGIQAYVEQHPELVQNVDRVFLFKMNEPESAWTIDLKNGSGSVTEGDPGGAGCTLELTEADFVAMSRGEADPQKLYFGGKLKITGDVMASQKLDFLQKIDPASMKDEVERRIAEYRSGERAPVEAAPGREAVAWTVFDKLSARLESKPELGAEVGAAIRFEIQNPDVSFVVELQEGTAKVHKGGDHRADTVLTMSDEDLEALVKGAEASQLYQRGQLRVDGDVQVAQRLAFIRGLL